MTRIHRSVGCRAEPLSRTLDRASAVAWKHDSLAAFACLPIEVLQWITDVVLPWVCEHPEADLPPEQLTTTALRYLAAFPESWEAYRRRTP
jgi:hypothetical protein